VAVVDSGIDLNHPDLMANLWTNPADASHGWNVIANSNNPSDDFGHGTFVAGEISAVINNGIGVAGVAQEQIMAVKVLDAFGNTNADQTATGITWAVNHGANIINLSLGGTLGNLMLQNAVSNAWQRGALLVAAVGNNEGNVVDYPAAYTQVMAIAAHDMSDNHPSFSNYGSKVELSALGVSIYSTMWNGNTLLLGNGCFLQQYCYQDGTSYSTAFVSGVAALAWDYYMTIRPEGTITNQIIRDALDTNTDTIGSPSGNGPNPNIGNANWNSQFGYGKPDALLLLQRFAGVSSLTIGATWQYFSSSGTEQPAKVYVQDVTTNTILYNWVQVGNGLTFGVTVGHEIRVQYT
jgi:hypothetical protein